MNDLCYRLIERTKEQMQALGSNTSSGTTGKRPSRMTVTPAVTNGNMDRNATVRTLTGSIASRTDT